MNHVYSDTFFDYIDDSARRSADALIGALYPLLTPASVLDLGCGRGVWLDVWQAAGTAEICGIDGSYVDENSLAIPPSKFLPADLTQPINLGRRFELAQSLEVGEHLPEASAETLVESLTQASDRILFSAAVVGQGGENHINEQPLAYWQEKFAARGYRAYDCLRPGLRKQRDVAPWYRYNSVLYVNEIGGRNLPDEIRKCALPDGAVLRDAGDVMWRLRRRVVAQLPRGAVTGIAQTRAAWLAAKARRSAPAQS